MTRWLPLWVCLTALLAGPLAAQTQDAPKGDRPKAGTGDISDATEAVDAAVVTVQAGKRLGAGFIVNTEGQIVTCAHVVQKDKAVQVRLADKQAGTATVVATDTEKDLAILKMDLNPPATVKLGASQSLKLGETVVAVGSPVGLEHSVTRGCISARMRRIGSQSYLQVDVPLNRGNSGGPVVDVRGAVVGVATFIAKDANNVGFAVPSEVLASFLDKSGVAYETVAGDNLKPLPEAATRTTPDGTAPPGAPAQPAPSLPLVLGLSAAVAILCSALTSLLVAQAVMRKLRQQPTFAAPGGRRMPPPPPEDLTDVDITLH
jgi:S1-C subfamily serine protease